MHSVACDPSGSAFAISAVSLPVGPPAPGSPPDGAGSSAAALSHDGAGGAGAEMCAPAGITQRSVRVDARSHRVARAPAGCAPGEVGVVAQATREKVMEEKPRR